MIAWHFEEFGKYKDEIVQLIFELNPSRKQRKNLKKPEHIEIYLEEKEKEAFNAAKLWTIGDEFVAEAAVSERV